MPKIIQINVTANSGSTGRIAEQINQLAQSRGWKTYIAYGRDMQPSKSELIYVGNDLQVKEHFIEAELFDNDGLASRLATQKLIRRIKEIEPDVVHLHNIHGHWLNYKLLLEYLCTLDIPIVWTTHDPWPFTGCGHFSMYNCYRWRDGGCTNGCPRKKGHLLKKVFEKTREHFATKRKLTLAIKNLTIVPNSKWMEAMVKQSYLKNNKIFTILNGIDIDIFRPRKNEAILRKYGIDGIRYVVGVASVWYTNKGLKDYIRLSEHLGKCVKVVLVGGGLKADLLRKRGIIVVPRTENVEELVAIYSNADVVLNLSYQESFGLTSVEGYACGRPTIVYDCTASPELVEDDSTGRVVEAGNIDGIVQAIDDLMSLNQKELADACRKRAVDNYDKNKKYIQYMDLYESLISREIL